jgi:spore coat protein U-like protein
MSTVPVEATNMKSAHINGRGLRLALALAAAGGAFGVNSHAATSTSNLAVSAEINASCLITVTPLAFGNYDPITGVAVNGTGSVATNCTLGSSPVITLGQGATPASGSTEATPLRQMASGANRLTYFLYQDSGHGIIWGNTPTSGQSDPATGTFHTPLIIYGVITANQNMPAGNYSDTVVATVTY